MDLGYCKSGQKVLDIGTGTGVLPRNMYRYGAEWVGTDISDHQIEQAKRLAEDAGMKITFFTSKAEDVSFPDKTFDVITACHATSTVQNVHGCDPVLIVTSEHTRFTGPKVRFSTGYMIQLFIT